MINMWISFLKYLLYRAIRFLVHSFQKHILWRLNGVNHHLKNQTSGDECQILSILFKKKLVEDGDITNSTDFIWWHQKFNNTKILADDPCWTLYTIDKEYAYFVLVPKPWPYYNAKRAPFVFLNQYDEALGLARMSLLAFCRFADKNLEEPKGPVVFYCNAARSGSTLLTRVMQVSEKHIATFSEPDAFTLLAILLQQSLITESMAIDILKAMFKFYCKTQHPGQTYFIKPPSNASRLIPLVKNAMPNVKHMFTFRHNTRRVISSVEKMFRAGVAGDVITSLWNISPKLACHMIGMAGYEFELWKRFGMRDCLDMAIIAHVAAWYYYQKYRNFFHIPLIYYEDLVSEKEKYLRLVFQICELPYDQLIGEALKELSYDSQGGTVISQEKQKMIPDTHLDDERIKKMNEMCDQLGVPRIEI